MLWGWAGGVWGQQLLWGGGCCHPPSAAWQLSPGKWPRAAIQQFPWLSLSSLGGHRGQWAWSIPPDGSLAQAQGQPCCWVFRHVCRPPCSGCLCSAVCRQQQLRGAQWSQLNSSGPQGWVPPSGRPSVWYWPFLRHEVRMVGSSLQPCAPTPTPTRGMWGSCQRDCDVARGCFIHSSSGASFFISDLE